MKGITQTLWGKSLLFFLCAISLFASVAECRIRHNAPAAPAVSGRFDQALRFVQDTRVWAQTQHVKDYSPIPLTVECWAKVTGSNNEILVSHHYKNSQKHWELYSCAGTGVFSVFCPGWTAEPVYSNRPINDGQWHYLAMAIDGKTIQLYVDGKQVGQAKFELKETMFQNASPLMVGQTMLNEMNYLGCEGLVDEVRVSNTARKINGVPSAAFLADEYTIGLWHLDSQNPEGRYPDYSDWNNPLIIKSEQQEEWQCLDEKDGASFDPGPSPLDSDFEIVKLQKGSAAHPHGVKMMSLDGTWQLAQGGLQERRLEKKEWIDVIPAKVPGSIHSALLKDGLIPEPWIGLQDAVARNKSFKTWWYKRQFQCDNPAEYEKLVFDGVAVKADFWLNGEYLGSHEGMFGGPSFDVKFKVKKDNTLIVKIHPAPYKICKGEPNPFFDGMNVGWLYTVVFNNCYGWHYCNIPAIGIWQSVRLEGVPEVEIEHPFLATQDANNGTVDLVTNLDGPADGWSGTLVGTIEPENFSGCPWNFRQKVSSVTSKQQVHLRFTVPDAKLWWPNDMGQHNLYKMKLSFVPQQGGKKAHTETIFGIRTVEMGRLPMWPHPKMYKWKFIINGKPMFVKGANWCTMDALMDFSYERYERFINLAADQHIQMLRAWGSGMPETDEFYDLCNRKGIMVLQEWPTAWNSHKEGWQPYDILEETVRLNTLRLRNNPSLVMWGAGNESDSPSGKAIDMMGRYAVELDGTRAFHRAEPWGGSLHNYDVYWGRKPLDYWLKWENLEAHIQVPGVFIGEFGIASYPIYESVLRFMPDDEQDVWPAPEDGSFAHHTPVFNQKGDMIRLRQYSEYFMPGETMEDFVKGSQLSQATGVRHPLELARCRWPKTTGALYYKLNDNYPAASWSTVDWYGTPKLAHYVIQDAFAPLHACALFPTLNAVGEPVSLEVWLLDDTDELKASRWKVVTRAYDEKLQEIKRQEYKDGESIDKTKQLGRFELSTVQTRTTPLFIVTEIIKNGKLAHRTYYWMNYEADKGSLYDLPATDLRMTSAGNKVAIRNEGTLPAVGVNVSRPDHMDTFTTSDNFFWLDPGEEKTITVNETEGLVLKSWNQM
jgi:beta-mannosidase